MIAIDRIWIAPKWIDCSGWISDQQEIIYYNGEEFLNYIFRPQPHYLHIEINSWDYDKFQFTELPFLTTSGGQDEWFILYNIKRIHYTPISEFYPYTSTFDYIWSLPEKQI